MRSCRMLRRVKKQISVLDAVSTPRTTWRYKTKYRSAQELTLECGHVVRTNTIRKHQVQKHWDCLQCEPPTPEWMLLLPVHELVSKLFTFGRDDAGVALACVLQHAPAKWSGLRRLLDPSYRGLDVFDLWVALGAARRAYQALPDYQRAAPQRFAEVLVAERAVAETHAALMKEVRRLYLVYTSEQLIPEAELMAAAKPKRKPKRKTKAKAKAKAKTEGAAP